MDMKRGIVLGDNDDAFTLLDIVVLPKQGEEIKAVQFSMDLYAQLNLTMQDFVFYPVISDIAVSQTKLVASSIRMYDHDYNLLFDSVMEDIAATMNLQYKKGIPLAAINP